MPVINASRPHPTHPYVLVQINWADIPSVTHAGVTRVNAETGECTPLRPYVCYEGWELLLSCGHGTFWDTEAPFDTPFYYITTSEQAPCLPSAEQMLFNDTFSRVVVDGWGSTETGILSPLAYALAGGTVPGNYDVTGSVGTQTLDTVTTARTSSLAFGRRDFDLTVRTSLNVLATNDVITSRLAGRFTSLSNMYFVGINWETTGNFNAYISRVVGGVETVLAINTSVGTYIANTVLNVRFQGIGSTFRAKVWPAGGIEPSDWLLTATDTNAAVTGTGVALFSFRLGGNTNANAVMSWDTFRAVDECAPCEPVSASTNACAPVEPLLLDIFQRDVVDTWDFATSGQSYTLSGGTVPGDYDVTAAGGGTHNLTTVNVFRYSWAAVGQSDQTVTSVSSLPVGSPTGAAITRWTLARLTDNANYYAAQISVSTTGVVTLTVLSRVAGVAAILGAANVGVGHIANTKWVTQLRVVGSSIQAFAWIYGSPQPATPQVSVVDAAVPVATGVNAGVASRLETGNLNAPLLATWWSLRVDDPNATCDPVTITIPNDGGFWLKDPVRPCHDQPVPLCPTGAPVLPICGGPSGILFIGMGPEVYGANSFSLRPVNRSATLAITRPRGKAVSALQLQTVTFTDRDNLLELVNPGTPLLWQGPAEYGIPDRYMDVRDVQITAPLPDLRIQIRTESLPYITVERPAGPTQGICGARVADICDNYPTWNDLAAAGFTWDDLIAGRAAAPSANPDRRTWGDVDTEFADWAAVYDGGDRSWEELEGGS